VTILRLPLMPADVWSTLSPDPVPEVELGLHTIEGVDHYTADTDHCDESIPVKELTLVSMVSRLSKLIDREIDARVDALCGPVTLPVERSARHPGVVSHAYRRQRATESIAARSPRLAGLDLDLSKLRVMPTARARPAGLADEMTATATVTADGSMSVAFRGATATSKLSSMEPTIAGGRDRRRRNMAAHATRMLSEMSPPTDDDLHGPTGPLSVFVRIEYTVGGNRAGAGLLARAECGSSDDRRWVRWGLA